MNFPLALALMAAIDFDAIWNWDDPAESEKKFRALPASAEVQTQIARAQGLQGKFDEAHKTLDGVVTNSPASEVRYLLERGRVFNSSGKSDQARPLFRAAFEKAQAGQLEDLAVDAAHMLGILDGNAWNLQALALAEKSADPKAKNWVGSLLNNIGWAHYDKGEFKQALAAFERDVKWFDERKKTEQARIARYSVGKTLRALGRYDDALAQQRAIEKLVVDGYVFEELAECLLALKKPIEARTYFGLALGELSKDLWFVANETNRLARLKQLGQ